MKKTLYTVIIAFSLSLGACSSQPVLAPANTLLEKYAYAKTTESVMLTAATVNRRNGVITKATESYVVKTLKTVDGLLEESVILSKTDLTSANSQLEAALTIINSVKQFLNDNGIKQ